MRASDLTEYSNNQKGQIGINHVEGIILRDWNCRWQAIDGHNDDGVDGLLFFQKGAELTGQNAYVQVKLRSKIKEKDGSVQISLGTKRIRRNGARWNKLVGATILVLVDLETFRTFWVDLRSTEAFRGGRVILPVENKFDVHAKSKVEALCGTLHRDQLYPVITTERQDFAYLTGREHIQVAARRHYHSLRDDPVFLSGSDKPVRFLRSGWRHITRKERASASRFQSFVLLGAIRRILVSTSPDQMTLEGHKSAAGLPLYSTRYYVTFPFRQSVLVTLVLEKDRDENGEFFSFYTLYEPRRKRTALSVRESKRIALSK